MLPYSNYPTLTALLADMTMLAREAIATRSIVTLDDFRNAGLSSIGLVLDPSEGVRKAFLPQEIERHAATAIATVKAERAKALASGAASETAQCASPQRLDEPHFYAGTSSVTGLTRPEIARRFAADPFASRAPVPEGVAVNGDGQFGTALDDLNARHLAADVHAANTSARVVATVMLGMLTGGALLTIIATALGVA